MYVSPQSRDTALRCCFLCESYLSLPWDRCLGLVCLLSACNRLSWSRMLFLSGGAYRSFSAGLRLSVALRSHSASSRSYCSTMAFDIGYSSLDITHIIGFEQRTSEKSSKIKDLRG